LFSLESCFGLTLWRDPQILRRAALAQDRQRHAVTTIQHSNDNYKRLTDGFGPRNGFSPKCRGMNPIAELRCWMAGLGCVVGRGTWGIRVGRSLNLPPKMGQSRLSLVYSVPGLLPLVYSVPGLLLVYSPGLLLVYCPGLLSWFTVSPVCPWFTVPGLLSLVYCGGRARGRNDHTL
jgi:hypothetical protein